MPSAPFSGDSIVPMMAAPSSVSAPLTSSSTRARTSGSRITPRPREASARPASNWGFTRSTRSAPGRRAREQGGRDRPQGDERQVGHDEVDRSADGGGVERPDVGALAEIDALVVTKAFVQLAVADVDGDDLPGSALQQAVRESAGGRAGVEGPHTVDRDPESVEPGGQLLAAATHVDACRALHHDGVGGRDESGRLVGNRARDGDATLGDDFNGAFAARSETSPDELRVEAPPPTRALLGHSGR